LKLKTMRKDRKQHNIDMDITLKQHKRTGYIHLRTMTPELVER